MSQLLPIEPVQYTPSVSEAKRAGKLAAALEAQIRDAWDRREQLGEGCSDPVVLVLQDVDGTGDNDAPERAMVVIRSAAWMADEVSEFDPCLSTHLPHVDTSVPRIVVVMTGGLVLLGNDPPCDACRPDAPALN